MSRAPAKIEPHWPLESTALIRLADIQPPVDPGDIGHLAASIRRYGLLQPLLVRPLGSQVDHDGVAWIGVEAFQIVDGERRYRAAQLAGLTAVSCVIRPLTDANAAAVRRALNRKGQRAA